MDPSLLHLGYRGDDHVGADVHGAVRCVKWADQRDFGTVKSDRELTILDAEPMIHKGAVSIS